MNKIIIADDDFIVRTYLKQMIDWEKHGFLLFDAKNGREALDICLKERINIIITDMSMPVMNGMELIKSLKQRDFPCHIIVLSCHDDFIYVKEAMKLGADDYLLKNDLTPDGLLDVLHKISLQNSSNSEIDSDNVSTEELAQIGRHKLQNDFFQNFTDPSACNEQLLIRQAQKADIKSSFAAGSVILVKITDWRQRLNILDGDDVSSFKQAFKEMCRNICQNNEYGIKTAAYVFQPAENGEYWGILLDFTDENSRARLDRNLKTIARKINSFSQRYFNLNSVCAVSDIQSNLIYLKRSWLSLMRLNDISLYLNDTIFTETDFARISIQTPENLLKLLQKLINALNSDDTAFEALQQEFLTSIEQSHLNLKSLSNVIKRLEEAWSYDFHFDFNNFAEFKTQFTNQVRQKRNSMKKNSISHPAIRMAVKYIDEHYKDPLSQQIVADYVHLNPAYFSTLFKKSTGTNFSDYLINCRLNAVKKRLVNSSDKIKNIATEEGFADYQYFCKLFKKIVGLNPSEYRSEIKIKQ